MWVFAPGGFWFVTLTTVIPYAVVTYALATLLLTLLRHGSRGTVRRCYGGAVLLALGGVLLHAAIAAPSYLGAHASGRPDLTVMNTNLRLGNADAAEVVALARENQVELLVLEEVTAAERERLTAAGLDELLPHSAGGTSDGNGAGTMVFSKYELTDAERLPTRNGGYRLRVAAPDPFWMLAVHPSQPLKRTQEWQQDWHAINRAAAVEPRAELVVGDFNATLDHRPVRDLLGAGMSDAARRSNEGWQPTWSGTGTFGVITIDHVLFSASYDAIDTRAEKVSGTDHRALITELKRLGG